MESKKCNFPNKILVTIWSTSNCYYRCDNAAAVLTLREYGSYGNEDDAATKIFKHPGYKNEHDDYSNELSQSNFVTRDDGKKVVIVAMIGLNRVLSFSNKLKTQDIEKS